MPIIFELKKEEGYCIVKYIGQLTNEELISEWEKIFTLPEFSMELNELADVSKIDASRISGLGIRNFTLFINSYRKTKQSGVRKVAVFAPENHTFGLAKIYEGHTDDTIDNMHVFRDLEKAKKFLTSSE